MNRFLSILIVVIILSLGVIGALAGIPHVHGDDLDHSHHKSCPLYQFNLLNPNGNSAISETVVFLLFIFSVIGYCRYSFLFLNQSPVGYFFSRAPPIIL